MRHYHCSMLTHSTPATRLRVIDSFMYNAGEALRVFASFTKEPRVKCY